MRRSACNQRRWPVYHTNRPLLCTARYAWGSASRGPSDLFHLLSCTTNEFTCSYTNVKCIQCTCVWCLCEPFAFYTLYTFENYEYSQAGINGYKSSDKSLTKGLFPPLRCLPAVSQIPSLQKFLRKFRSVWAGTSKNLPLLFISWNRIEFYFPIERQRQYGPGTTAT